MNSALKISLILLLGVNFQVSQGQGSETQNEEKLSLNSGTIDNQFEYVIRRSNSYQDFKVVKKTWLYALKAHTMDSLQALRKDLANTQSVVDRQALNIETLQTSLANTEETLAKTEEEKNNMALFGMQLGKTNYNVLMWSIIAALFALLLFFIYKFKNSNTLTRQAKFKLEEVESEFEEHRRIALEREQKVRRQLQDEINKNKAK
ncbi:tRNA (guanine-N1)-methyltransferase [uncultured Winogradskyella sp.]|uniref:tRNA (guanine-N1)-methyltransferase n=1 Tax=uncultured Winogradskyella sp. TaxID=395353 RepID=UPI0035163107